VSADSMEELEKQRRDPPLEGDLERSPHETRMEKAS
jgi:hypothetical protein